MVETPLLHRDGAGGLFIGTSKLLFALMNSAPAELLHPLTYAALQPSIDCALYAAMLRRQSKKTPAITPASEYCFWQANSFFKENAALPDLIRCSGANRLNRFGLLLGI